MCVCVCMCICMDMYVYTHTHTREREREESRRDRGRERRLVEGDTIGKIKGREYTFCIWLVSVLFHPECMRMYVHAVCACVCMCVAICEQTDLQDVSADTNTMKRSVQN